MTDSYIKHGSGGTLLAGPDAIALFVAATTKSAINLLKIGIKPTRGYTMKKALAKAGEFTGKKYKRTEADKAIADLDVWCKTMNAALPHVED